MNRSLLHFSLAALACIGALNAGCREKPDASGWPKTPLREREHLEPAPEFGGDVYVVEAGSRDAPGMVLIHGLGERAARDFDPLLPALSARYHVLAFDLPGFGRSPRKELENGSPERYARFVEGMIARHFSGKVTLVGHSMGGGIAIVVASRIPERVERLALLDVAGILHYGEYTRELVNLRLSQRGHVFDPLRRAVRSLFAVGSRLFTDEDPRNMSIERTPAWLFIQHDFGPALRQIRAPVWIGWGKQDDVAPRRSAEALRYLLHARELTVYLHSGHTPMQSEPRAVASDLINLPNRAQAQHLDADIPLSTREGICNRERDRVFEGDYASIRIQHCKNVILRNVRTQALEFVHAKATLAHVDVTGGELGVTITQSQVFWTGGTIRAANCIDTASSRLNLAAVTCQFTQQGIRVRDRSKLLASVSVLEGVQDQRQQLHGEYTLPRNVRPE